MKSKILLFPLILLSISLLSTPVQAKKPQVVVTKERTTQWMDSLYRIEMLTHSVMVIKSYETAEEAGRVSISTTMYERLYDNEGKLVAIAKIQMHYVGTAKEGGQLWTGKNIVDWIINLMEDVPFPLPPSLKGHWVIWYEEGTVVREIGFGEPFFS